MAVEDHAERNLWAVVAYFIFFLPLLTKYRSDEYVRFHVGQALVLFIASFILWLLFYYVFAWIWIARLLIWIVFIAFWGIGIYNAASNKARPLPFIGILGEKFSL